MTSSNLLVMDSALLTNPAFVAFLALTFALSFVAGFAVQAQRHGRLMPLVRAFFG